MSVNSIVVSGRLGRDPELRSTSTSKSVAAFSIALDEGYGEKKKTIWLNIEAWDKTAEAVARLVTAGKRVSVVGRLSEDTWTDTKSGEKKSRFKVIANQIDIIDFPDKNQADGHGESVDDDIPF